MVRSGDIIQSTPLRSHWVDMSGFSDLLLRFMFVVVYLALLPPTVIYDVQRLTPARNVHLSIKSELKNAHLKS